MNLRSAGKEQFVFNLPFPCKDTEVMRIQKRKEVSNTRQMNKDKVLLDIRSRSRANPNKSDKTKSVPKEPKETKKIVKIAKAKFVHRQKIEKKVVKRNAWDPLPLPVKKSCRPSTSRK